MLTVVCHTFSVGACLAQGYHAFTGSGHVIDPATERKTLLHPTLMIKISTLIMLQPWHFTALLLSPVFLTSFPVINVGVCM